VTELELLNRIVAIRDACTDEKTREELNALAMERWGRASV